MAIADRYDAFLVDFDGVVWRGREPVPGAPEALSEMLAAGKRLAFVTNNPGRLPEDYARRLAALGVEVAPARVVTAGAAAARLAARAADGGGAFVVGAPALKELVARAGAPVLEGEAGREAAVVVVSAHAGFDYAELRTAKLALDGGAAFIATSRDPTMPMPGGDWPGTGAVLAAVETAAGRRAEIAGKPERHLFEAALEAIGAAPAEGGEEPPRVAMVGDRLTSDVAGGRAAGLDTVLVLTGATGREAAAAADPRPDHVVADLPALLA